MCSTSGGTLDPACVDNLAAARAASRKTRDGKRKEVDEAKLQEALASLDATVNSLIVISSAKVL
jgi:hypothetical protein